MAHSKVRLAVALLCAIATLSNATETLKPEEEEWRPNKTSPIVGLALAPSMYDLKVLSTQIEEAEAKEKKMINKITDQLLQNCEGEDVGMFSEKEARSIAERNPLVVKLRYKAAKAKADLANGQYWYYLEKKRQKDLPSLVLKIQEKANEAHRTRLKAEENATEAKRAADVAEEKYDKKMEPFQEAINKQRYEDRLRASQEVSIARQVAEKAAQARKQLAAKKKADDMVDMARQAYDEMQKKVTLAATQVIREKEKDVQKEVAEKTKIVVEQAAKYKTIQAKAKKFKLKSARSAMTAQVAKEEAIKDKRVYENVLKLAGELGGSGYDDCAASRCQEMSRGSP
mmetsp:Transcript_40404/g.71066  ORF Transcript_40404/g.71066 Transcript_40404/m.71066 type:complete len:342 (+) Transcript_40404:86-1111(+)